MSKFRCVMLDLVGTIINDAKDRLESGKKALTEEKWANAIYYAYNTLVIGAKAILLHKDIQCNTHQGIIEDFQAHVVEKGELVLTSGYSKIFPSDLRVGVVTAIKMDQVARFQNIIVEPTAELRTLEEVFILNWIREDNE